MHILLLILLLSLHLLPPPSAATRCSTNTAQKTYEKCTFLPTQDASIAWTFHPHNATLDAVFTGSFISPSGWVAIGINPDSPSMTGTRALIAFADPTTAALLLLPFILDPSVKLQRSPSLPTPRPSPPILLRLPPPLNLRPRLLLRTHPRLPPPVAKPHAPPPRLEPRPLRTGLFPHDPPHLRRRPLFSHHRRPPLLRLLHRCPPTGVVPLGARGDQRGSVGRLRPRRGDGCAVPEAMAGGGPRLVLPARNCPDGGLGGGGGGVRNGGGDGQGIRGRGVRDASGAGSGGDGGGWAAGGGVVVSSGDYASFP
ncbi:hypothetical protein HPP92_007750 [Vanilla planifolia]|uniref:DOMON domain-containing protein n=1 Tax=Vanilla planifolia TaxID=51239 RepID=A0A835RRT0_VANPL|nr:hypothetical protein HPP92_007750 [Vanilla planifolia]